MITAESAWKRRLPYVISGCGVLDLAHSPFSQALTANRVDPGATWPEGVTKIIMDAGPELMHRCRSCNWGVALRPGQTEKSVKSVWVRALARLRFTLEGLR
jgi:hypothetical protein